MTDKQIEELKELITDTVIEANNFIESFANNPNEENKKLVKQYVGMLIKLLSTTTKELCERSTQTNKGL